MARSPFNVKAHMRCECGHENMLHDSVVGCYIAGCFCKSYDKYDPPREPRAKIVKTLDREDPKLFEVEK